MKRIILAGILLFSGTAAASTGERCDVPVSDWQPREALQRKLEADGWKVNRIKTENGCYEAYAIDRDGNRIEAYFDPKTFAIVKSRHDD